jgi:Trk K+ transport system NAD-binding subunit
MKVIICGAGQVGWQIARHLSGERNDVTVVDNDPELINRATKYSRRAGYLWVCFVSRYIG